MKNIFVYVVALVVIPLVAKAQNIDDYLNYKIPDGAKKIGPIGTRHPDVVYYNYFFPASELNKKGLIAVETFEKDVLIELRLMRDAKLHGIQKTWHSTGILKSESPFKNGKMHGTFKHWNEGSDLVGQYDILDGEGLEFLFHDSGMLRKEIVFKNSQKNGRYFELDQNGQITSMGWCKDGRFIGRTFAFHSNGELKVSIVYNEAQQPTGPLLEYDRKGKPIGEFTYYDSGKEVAPNDYALMSEIHKDMPSYFEDADEYKETILTNEILSIVERYKNQEPVKIPLEFDEETGELVKR